MGALSACGSAFAQEQPLNRRELTILAREDRFEPNHVEVSQNDLLRITLKSDDHPRSFAIDAYRILKRVGAGQTIVFEFRTDRSGTFTFYCSLTSDASCRDMKGTLVVNPR